MDPKAKAFIMEVDLLPEQALMRQNRPVALREPVSFETFFQNSNPVELELGFGTGRFITEFSRTHPQVNLFGVEITRKMVYVAANKLFQAGLRNVRLLHADGEVFLKAKVADQCLQRVHVYFPDPWVKKRHIKRRIVNRVFLDQVFRVLVPGGRFNFFTDHADYVDYFLEERKNCSVSFQEDSDIGDYVPTSYEEKWVRQGKPIFRTVLRKPE